MEAMMFLESGMKDCPIGINTMEEHCQLMFFRTCSVEILKRIMA
jgi:hypothetical protein